MVQVLNDYIRLLVSFYLKCIFRVNAKEKEKKTNTCNY